MGYRNSWEIEKNHAQNISYGKVKYKKTEQR